MEGIGHGQDSATLSSSLLRTRLSFLVSESDKVLVSCLYVSVIDCFFFYRIGLLALCQTPVLGGPGTVVGLEPS